ncbi:T9SS type A sorting domain-containing protein [Hymenobacter aquaticus]|uniref:T9SS type A sorting domain-containing protein n=1 Tax=Hymenobacter aquaticus TaxID=1867101 RepID=A0A4Z0Q3N9_9BACT|nr:T9SS type A sorting domain-containing protein [Hymenobacter aquaticus]TGE24204.1 T9SS type A sorting domain-containing protein [Hymenobacter aquaticus]
MCQRLLRLSLGAALISASALPQPVAAQAPAKQWDKSLGGTSAESLGAAQPTTDGGFILGGNSGSSISGDKTQAGRGGTDYWLVKLDANGNKMWDKTFGGPDNEHLVAVQQTRDGGYIVGGRSTSGIGGDKTQANKGGADYWVLKLDANGTKLWDRSFGGLYTDALSAVQQTSDGGYLLLGGSNSNSSPDKTQPAISSSYDYWIVKLDANGTKLWDKTYGGGGHDNANSLTLTRDGGAILGGFSNSDAWADKTQDSRGHYDGWVVKIDALGNKQWDRTLGSYAYEEIVGVQQAPDGGYLLAAISTSGIGGDKTQENNTLGISDYWIVKLDATGQKIWDRSFGGSANEDARTVQLTSDGGLLVGGLSSSGISGSKTQASRGVTDYWLINVDGAGNLRWDLTLGGAALDQCIAITSPQSATDNGLLIAGTSDSGISGDKTQPSYGNSDFWIVKLRGTTLSARARAGTRQELRVSPNPAHGQVTLHLPEQAPRIHLRLALMDATGRTVCRQSVAAGGGKVPFEVSQYPAGLYVLRLEGPNGYLATQRLELN